MMRSFLTALCVFILLVAPANAGFKSGMQTASGQSGTGKV